MAHISKFVRPGAVRVDSNQEKGKLENVAFRNPDGTMVLVAATTGEEDASFKVVINGKEFHYSLPAKSAVTFRWKPINASGRLP
ncbi:glycoside hydrolase family 30 beta sandwich domain-containing protein [Paenibacillus sp. DCT19]|uniref:glycoside hydrolase family 30 beta sandwich domain-containing protein n=1 Tax=Paenibacillus sp. DCT19 TaxID=2211212 RepID=UPI0020C3F6DF|nr:glycoside hydrolase family 30 beta sandwich domain-containing protein [Paenibacillus sp. DCT19]